MLLFNSTSSPIKSILYQVKLIQICHIETSPKCNKHLSEDFKRNHFNSNCSVQLCILFIHNVLVAIIAKRSFLICFHRQKQKPGEGTTVFIYCTALMYINQSNIFNWNPNLPGKPFNRTMPNANKIKQLLQLCIHSSSC